MKQNESILQEENVLQIAHNNLSCNMVSLEERLVGFETKTKNLESIELIIIYRNFG